MRQSDRPYFIGIGGGTGSGKTTIAEAIAELVPREWITTISMDNYYQDFSPLPFEERVKVNYDHPDAFDWDLLLDHLERLSTGESIQMFQYDFTRHVRRDRTAQVEPTEIIILEGILALYHEKIRRWLDVKIYVDTEPDERILRRIERDIHERGRSLDSVIRQYRETVKPMHEAFVEPTKKDADIIIPEGMNTVAVDLLRSKIERVALERAGTGSGEGGLG
ncbi:MAG: uridine kinase [Candidatus Bipolaricaulia bacterium]